ncbi:MAG: 30S ribosome-binding factor RbfA [Deltaproteobacteria bacterium]|nr:30S ribosome-binding factor RbfA [Deltaproteobacteria bacterium]
MTRRLERIAGQLQQELGLLLLRGVKDPRVALVTLTGVTVSPDLSLARVFYTVVGDEQQRRHAVAGLRSCTSFLRRMVGQRLQLRKVPVLEFRYDESAARAQNVQRLLEQIGQEVAAQVEDGALASQVGPREEDDGCPASEDHLVPAGEWNGDRRQPLEIMAEFEEDWDSGAAEGEADEESIDDGREPTRDEDEDEDEWQDDGKYFDEDEEEWEEEGTSPRRR